VRIAFVRCVVIIALLLPCVPPLEAARTEFVAEKESQRLAGAEVCFFPGGRDDGFFTKFLSSADVRCVSADMVIDLPTGSWNYVLRHDDGWVSTHPGFVSGDFETAEEQPPHRRVVLPMHPATRVDISHLQALLEEEEHLAFYLSNEGIPSSPPSVRPVPREETSVLLPTGMTILPMVVSAAQPQRIGTPLKLPSGSPAFPSVTAGTEGLDVLMALKIAADASELDRIRSPLTAKLVLEDGTGIDPLLPLRPGRELERSLLVFRGVPPGAAFRLVLESDDFEPVEIRSMGMSEGSTEGARSGLVIPQRFIELRPAGSIQVTWSVDETIPATLAGCEAAGQAEPALRVRKCVTSSCVPLRTHRVAGLPGMEEFRRLAAGEYEVVLSSGPYSEVQRVRVEPLRQSRAVLSLEPTATVSGTVTLDGTPVHAQIRFARGGGGVSDPYTGFYSARVGRDPLKGEIFVQPCDGSTGFSHFPEEPIYVNSIYSIEIERSVLTVRALSAEGEPVAEARVSAHRAEPDDPWVMFGGRVEGTTAEDGLVELAGLTRETDLGVCASHPDFEYRCEGLRLESAQQTAEIRLEPKRVKRGRVIASTPFVRHGRIYWFSEGGEVRAMALVRPGGTFEIARKDEDALRYPAVLVSSDHPLGLLDVVPGEEELTYRLAPRPVTSFEIFNPPASSLPDAAFTLLIDGRIIPAQAVAGFQMHRRSDNRIARGERAMVGPVASSAVSVVVGPRLISGAGGDFFSLSSPAHVLAMTRLPVPEGGSVVIP
jgi:hypothetical protein